MSTVDKVRIIVVGDSGVGKTSYTHLVANNEALTSPGWTIGCSVEVKLHEYKEGTSSQCTYFVELWDVGGSISHLNTRGVFYNPVNGIILVHDLTNRKSHENLQKWLLEILSKDGKDAGKNLDIDIDPEQFLGATQIPILVVGTKADLVDDLQRMKQKTGNIADQCGADEILLNCHDSKSLSAGTTNSVNLGRFFDKVIERKFYSKENYYSGSGGGGADKRRFATNNTSPFNNFWGANNVNS